MIWFFYNLAFPFLFLLLLPRFLVRMCRRGGYRDRFAERFGRFDPGIRARLAEAPRLWVHAVSVGEMFAALDFIRAYRARFPGARFAISTVTSTGRALALQKADPADGVIYFPLDFPPFVRRALETVRPRVLILTEGDLWPNLLREARARAIPVAVINGRLSEKSARGYGRVRPLVRSALGNVDLILAQSEADRARYLALGAAPERVEARGSIKFEISPDPEAAARARAVIDRTGWPSGARLLVGGSTWPGEEAALAEAVRRLRIRHPDLRLILAPRHAERAGRVAEELAGRGFRLLRRSALAMSGAPADGSADLLLVDTTGELKAFYAAADLVFVGKSLFDNRGGQNFIEPAAYGKPVLTGPHVENFSAVADDFRAADAWIQVDGLESLVQAMDGLLRDPAAAAALGRRAVELVARRRGVLSETVTRIGRLAGEEGA